MQEITTKNGIFGQQTKHKLLLDVTDLSFLEDNSIDAVISCPTFQDNKDASFLDNFFIEIKRVLKDDGSAFFALTYSCTDILNSTDVAKIASEHFSLQNKIIWCKNISVEDRSFGKFRAINSDRFLNHNYEEIFHFTKTGKEKIDKMAIAVSFEDMNNSKRWKSSKEKRCRGDIWFCDGDISDTKGRTFIPVDIATNCIKLLGKTEGTIFDPYCGSGNVLLSAKINGFNSIGIDKDSSFLEEAGKRLKSA